MISSWPPKYYHFTPWGARLSLIWAAHPLLAAPWSQLICREFLYQFPLLCTPACSFEQGEDAALLSRALCTGCPCPGAAGEAPGSSSSGPSTATAEPSNDAGSTSVRKHLRKRKMPSQEFLHVDKLTPEPTLGCSCAGGRWCLKIINTDDIFALAAIHFPASSGFLC